MKFLATIAVVILLSLVARSKNAPATVTETASPATAGAASAPKFVSAVAQNQPAENVVGEVDSFLTGQLQIFIRDQQRMPQDFAEFARVRLDSVPRPPQGRKWVIDAATRQVKSVAQP